MLLADDDCPDLTPVPKDQIPSPTRVLEQSEQPIALTAISATKHARGRAMRLEGFICHTPIHVFIDSGTD